jgi:outer membrane PBP1 activator LpoA protein
MKKLLSVRAAACLVMTVLLFCLFAGCGSSSDNKESSGSASVASEVSAQSESKTENSERSKKHKWDTRLILTHLTPCITALTIKQLNGQKRWAEYMKVLITLLPVTVLQVQERKT